MIHHGYPRSRLERDAQAAAFAARSESYRNATTLLMLCSRLFTDADIVVKKGCG